MFWLEADGLRAIGVMGMPEWRDASTRYTLEAGDNEWFRVSAAILGSNRIADYEAACLLRDHAVEWLASRDEGMLHRAIQMSSVVGLDNAFIRGVLAVHDNTIMAVEKGEHSDCCRTDREAERG